VLTYTPLGDFEKLAVSYQLSAVSVLAVCSLQWAVFSGQSSVLSPQSAVFSLQSALSSIQLLSFLKPWKGAVVEKGFSPFPFWGIIRTAWIFPCR